MNRFKKWLALGMVAVFGASLVLVGCSKSDDAAAGADGTAKGRDAAGVDAGGDRAKDN